MTSADVRYDEARDARQQEQKEPSDVVVTGNAVPSAVPSGVRSSGMHVRVDDSMQVASMEHDHDNSWNCHYNLPPRVCVAGRADLPLAVCATTADNGITSQRATPRRRHTQLRGNGSDYDDMLAHSQFDNPSVCTLVAGRGDFSHCNDDDDSRMECTFSRQATAARLRGHSPGRSHSLPPPVSVHKGQDQ